MVGHIAKGLAFAFLAGAWTEDELIARGRAALGDGGRGRLRWLRRRVRRPRVEFPAAPVDREDERAAVLADDRALRAVQRDGARVRRWLIPEATMLPVEGAPARFRVPSIASAGELAARLGLRHE